MEAQKWIRRIAKVEAVQFTVDNIAEVVKWAGGVVNTYSEETYGDWARAGFWLVKDPDGLITAYTDEYFREHFVRAKGEN